jgi:hypothetical protein
LEHRGQLVLLVVRVEGIVVLVKDALRVLLMWALLIARVMELRFGESGGKSEKC